VRLLFISSLGDPNRPVYRKKWSSGMNLLFVSKLDRSARSVYTIAKYAEVGAELGHQVALFGEQTSAQPDLPYSLDVQAFDFAIFVVHESWDFPDMPYLAQLLDGIPKERRVIIDCCGRYNETVRVEHDFNHLEKMDGHQGWEWIEGFQAVARTILQPTLTPLRSDVRSFLWHGFDPRAVKRQHSSAPEAARSWMGSNGSRKPYGLAYVGHNWQRWTQVRHLLEAIEPLREEIGPICLAGNDWGERPAWAIDLGIQGADLDPTLLQRLSVQTKPPLPYNEVIDFAGQARFSPVIHRPLFNRLGLVTNRTFSTFCADTIPLLLLPEELIDSVYGPDAKLLSASDDIACRLDDMLRRPESYWDAVLKVRAHLSGRHSFQRRFQELAAILEA
jgi:hypothetical protein